MAKQKVTRVTQDSITKKVQALLGRKLTKDEMKIVNLSIAVNSSINMLVQEQKTGVAPKIPKRSPGSSSADVSTSNEGANIQKY